MFVKEVTFKNQDRKGENNNLRLAEYKIKALIKKVKVQDQEEDEKLE